MVSDQVAACSAEASDDKRLACYDGVAQQLQRALPSGPDAASEAANRQSNSIPEIKDGDTFGQWRAEVTVDAMTDKRTVSFANLAVPGLSDSAAEARIGLLCSDKRISLVWLSRAYLGKRESSLNNVTYRIDAEKPRSEAWNTFKNIATPDNALPIVEAMAEAKRLVLNIRGYDFESHQAVFELDGVAKVLAQLPACWPPQLSPPAPASATSATTSPVIGAAPAQAHTTGQRPRR